MRKYSGEQELIWGGDNHCKHQWGTATARPAHPDRSTGDHDSKGSGIFVDRIARGEQSAKAARGQAVDFGAFCSLCGAWKGAYGLEPTPEMYIEHTIEILREIRRVLRPDGVVFWNIGDSYAGSGSPGGDFRDGKGGDEYLRPYNRKGGVLKPKDLCLIPFRVAISAQMDGWWVRSIIIWEKLNPMPESVNGWRWEKHRIKIKTGIGGRRAFDRDVPLGGISTDTQNGHALWRDCPSCPTCEKNDGYVLRKGSWRPTESHEYIIMLTKTDTYYSDAEAVREPYSPTKRWGGDTYKGAVKKGSHGEDGGLDRERSCFPGTGRNLRSVWTFPTVPFPSFKIDGKKIDHFAVFPDRLPQLCIKAATPEVGCCSKCGAPWTRVLDKKPNAFNIRVRDAKAGRATPEEGYKATQEEIDNYPGNHPDPGYRQTKGWQPTCKCNADKVPSIVLDPFLGAGTTLWVAKKLNRQAVGYEISEEYCRLAVDRCRQQTLGL